ncbi:type III pantothenate kinase [Nibrella saemangeumensis]|uniref:Type III pantothenate kinase n=1 Tax=Nibrella saemangeumensis TaxID=1084526 RepID=A0ABP8NNV7_9BACT
MLLAVDIGNSDIVFGLYANETWQHIWRTPSRPDEPATHYATQVRLWLLEADVQPGAVATTVLSSVVPPLTPIVQNVLQVLFEPQPIVVGPAIYPYLPLEVLRPYEIGTDLVANALSAYMRYRRNCVVVDFGTALSFTVVTGDGRIVGVSIAPGLRTAIHSLFTDTAQLPEVPIELPASALGTNTTQAIQIGVVLGYEGLIRFLIQRTRAELNGDCIAVATGGLSAAIPTLQDEFIDIIPSLTLDGIRLIGELSQTALQAGTADRQAS